jgi:uridine phosphorylase
VNEGPSSLEEGLRAHHFPLAEFDHDRSAMLEPASSHFGAELAEPPDMPAVAVACFFGDVVEQMAADLGAELVVHLAAEHGRHSVYAIEHGGLRIAFYQAGLGAPLAAYLLEQVIDYGCNTVVACGGCGALDASLGLGQVILVEEALRDEGTSFHYLPAQRTVRADPDVVSVMEQVLARAEVPTVRGKVWSTDGIYRETRGKVARRREEGCIAVEMEAAALLAVSQFRGVRFGQLLYAGDSLAGESWDEREWYRAHDVRQQMFFLAADVATGLALGVEGRSQRSPEPPR